MDVKEIISLLKNPSHKDIELISRAFEFSRKAHEGQERYSGESYFIHPFETAKILAKLQIDAVTVAAGLLHDVCEDCLITGEKTHIDYKIIKKEFGEEIAFLVESVSKLGMLKLQEEERRVESLRKMFLAMAKDIRVVLIKLADRLHNMETLEYVPQEKRKRIAMETLEIYAPLANRLGIGEFKGRLEDRAFFFIYPEEYQQIKNIMEENYKRREIDLAKIKYKLVEILKEHNFKDFKIDSRVKHLYSLFKKLQRPEINNNINLVYDLIALRIIVKTIEECYQILGIIHHLWKPLPKKIKDYIALPKPNGYQSLHTTVFADEGKIIEIQIRTEKMHEEAEFGITAHWAYEESGKPKSGGVLNPRLKWVNQLIEWQKDLSTSETGTSDTRDFLESLRLDFFNDRVFCFTPKGHVIDLPERATVIDFAYAIHSDIGNHAVGALVNNKYVSLDSVLKNGDIVEIQIQKNKKPSLEWLEHAKTSLARKQIKIASKKKFMFKQ
ncbi:MAG: RelA/SpoT family protein [Patescibacteria group bacterium]